MLTLPEFIALYGARGLSETLDIKLATVRNWIYFNAIPCPQSAYKLIKYSEGLLTWESIYLPFVEYRELIKDRPAKSKLS